MKAEIEIITADWPAPRGIIAGTTTRVGGISTGACATLNLGAHVGDAPRNVTENRRRFLGQCQLPAEPSWLRQVHGTNIAVDPDPGYEPAADAILSRSADKVCVVLTADCLPVLMTSSDGSEIAAAHAGWRGLCNGVLETTVAAFRSRPGDILAWLGPAISQENFEVGEEVRQAFIARDKAATDCFVPNARGRWQADLYGLARRRLTAAGVLQIHGGQCCTYADSGRFFSYRRDGECGRMASFVFRNGETG